MRLVRKPQFKQSDNDSAMPRSSLMLSLVFLLCSTSIASAQGSPTGTSNLTTFPLVFKLRDAQTGIGLQGVPILAQRVENEAPTNLQSIGLTDSSGDFRAKLPAGEYAVEVRPAGFTTGRDLIVLGPNTPTESSELDVEPHMRRQDFIDAEAKTAPGSMVIYGLTLNGVTHQPLAGVDVEDREAGAGAVSDASGFYSFSIPAKPNAGFEAGEDRETTILKAHKDGFVDQVFENFEVTDNDAGGVRIQMMPGRGKPLVNELALSGTGGGEGVGTNLRDNDDTPNTREPEVPISKSLFDWIHVSTEPIPADKGQASPALNNSASSAPTLALNAAQPGLAQNPTIIVGLNCFKTTCLSHVSLPLETYVKEGQIYT